MFERQKQREMKRVFQWRRYLEWKNLTSEEKLKTKRFFFIPVFAYVTIEIFKQYFTLILLLLICYVLYKKFEKEDIAIKKIKY